MVFNPESLKGLIPAGHPDCRLNTPEVKAKAAKGTKKTTQLKTLVRKVLNMKLLVDPELYGIDPKQVRAMRKNSSDLEDPEMLGLTYEEAIAFQLVHMAAGGNLKAIQDLFDRTEGKAMQPTENTNVEVSYIDFLNGLSDDERSEENETRMAELLE